MNVEILIEVMRNAVDKADFKSSLPSGQNDDTVVVPYLRERQKEIISAARSTLTENVNIQISDETVLRLLFGSAKPEDLRIIESL